MPCGLVDSAWSTSREQLNALNSVVALPPNSSPAPLSTLPFPRRVRRPCMVDLACGHGFTGILYAAMEESVQSVLLVDARKPQSFEILLAAVAEVRPPRVGSIHL